MGTTNCVDGEGAVVLPLLDRRSLCSSHFTSSGLVGTMATRAMGLGIRCVVRTTYRPVPSMILSIPMYGGMALLALKAVWNLAVPYRLALRPYTGESRETEPIKLELHLDA